MIAEEVRKLGEASNSKAKKITAVVEDITHDSNDVLEGLHFQYNLMNKYAIIK